MHSPKPRRSSGFAAVRAACAAALVMGLFGCEELSSRRQIQEGNKLYAEGQFRKAIEVYDEALQRSPELAIGHHNAGLAYFKLFQPGLDTPENKGYAQNAAAHFQTYLETEPDDQKVISLLTTIWLDSEQYEKALSYWSGVLAKEPNRRDVIEKVANIHRQAGEYDKALEWHTKRADLETDRGGKVKVYLDIAQMQWSRLQKPEVVDAERVAAVDVGLAALQKAETLDPKHTQVQSLLGSLYQHRALGHGAQWAKAVEAASQRYHQIRFTELRKAEAAEAAAPQPGAPAKPGTTPPPAPK
jgi:tetratricopeptide (TPR) repeat protein